MIRYFLFTLTVASLMISLSVLGYIGYEMDVWGVKSWTQSQLGYKQERVEKKPGVVDVSSKMEDWYRFGNAMSDLKEGEKFSVLACHVLDGHHYELLLSNRKVISAQLRVASKEGAKDYVKSKLEQSVSPLPYVVLVRRSGDYWIVDFYLTLDGKYVNMLDLLEENDLLLH